MCKNFGSKDQTLKYQSNQGSGGKPWLSYDDARNNIFAHSAGLTMTAPRSCPKGT